MKSEHRHELESNELAQWLEQALEKIRPYRTYLFLVVGLALGAVFVSSVMGRQAAEKRELAWEAYALANYTSDLELNDLRKAASADEFAGSNMQEWAYITWADRQLLLAIRFYLSDRDAASEHIKAAQNIYATLADGASDPQLRDRAHLGQARIYELQDKIDEARLEYGMVGGDFAIIAEAAMERLNSPKADETIEWLATTDLPTPELPTGGATGERPSFDVDLPEASGEGSADPRSLEEILSGFAPSSEENRYDESSEEESEAQPADDESTEAAPVSEEEAQPEAEEATPAADESAPAEEEAAPAAEAPAEPAGASEP